MNRDPMIERYREASAHEDVGPSAALREKILAQAQARLSQKNMTAKSPAANDGAWLRRLVASVAVIGIAGIVGREFLHSPPPERTAMPAQVNAPAPPATNYTTSQVTAAAASEKRADAAANETTDTNVRRAAEPPKPAAAAKAKASPTQAQAGNTERQPINEATTKTAPLVAEEPPPVATAPAPATARVVTAKTMAAASGTTPPPVALPAPAPIAAAPAASPAPMRDEALRPSPSDARAFPAPASANMQEHAAVPESAFIRAIRANDVERVRLWVEASRELARAQSTSGASALHVAVGLGHADIASILLRHGADVNARDALGRTPLTIAITRGLVSIESILRAAGGVE